MQSPSRAALLRYGGAVVAVFLAVLARVALDPVLKNQFPFATLFLGVLVVAAYAGRGPALLAVGLGAVASARVFLPPRHSFMIESLEGRAGLVLYLVVGVGIALLGGALSHARKRASDDAEKAIRQREQLQASLASIGDAVLFTDAGGRVTLLNPIAEALTGWTSSEAAGRSLPAILNILEATTRRELKTPALVATAEFLALGRAGEGDMLLIARDGSERPIDVGASPIRDEHGRVTGGLLIVRDVAERRRQEHRLREGEERFRGLMEQAPFSIQILSPDGRTLRVNRAWEKLWGLTLEHFAEDNGLHDPRPAARGVLPDIRRAFAGEPVSLPPIPYDLNEISPDQTPRGEPVRWVSTVAYPLKDAAGRVREVVVVHDDITVRRRAEEAIRASEARFRHLADAMPQMVWITRPDRSVEYVNRRWLDYTGQTIEVALAPQGWPSVIHPDDLSEVMKASVRANAQCQPFEAEYRIRDASGAYHWYLGRSEPVFDEAGRLVGRFGAATDIDDRKRAERDAHFLAEASAGLASIVDEASTLQRVARLAVPHFADWCAVDLAVEGDQPQRVAVAHVDPAKVELGHELHRRYPTRPDTPHGILQVIRSGEPQLVAELADEMLVASARDDDHLEILRQLGLRSYICVPLRGRSGTLGAISFVAAESGRRYNREDLRLAQDLSTRAAIAIENSRLYGELKETDRRKDEFLATLAHELRNPLAPIRNALHLLRGMEGDATREAERAMAERNVVHLARLIDDLMDIARINRGKIELARKPVDLAAIVRQAVETARPLLLERRHDLITTGLDRPILLEADPTRLEQVLWNLLNNAAKYSNPGGRITLSVESAGREVVVRVRDTGIGIAPEMLPRIFDLFVQVGDHKEHAQGGLGIGLSLVRTLIELHGGSISARSDGPGTGSEFVLRLPAAPALPADAAPDLNHRVATPATPPRRRVLVVDDNVDAAVSLARLLTRLHGQHVRVAHDGPSALALTEEFRPEFVLLDIGLPGMDGNEVARRMRQSPAAADACIVAITGLGREADLARSRDAGFDAHLVKPADPDIILELLNRPQNRPVNHHPASRD